MHGHLFPFPVRMGILHQVFFVVVLVAVFVAVFSNFIRLCLAVTFVLYQLNNKS